MTAATTTRLFVIDCPHQVELVCRIAGVLFRAGFSIVSNHELVVSSARHFCMRSLGDPFLRHAGVSG